YTEAVTELDAVLREVPQHQRAREYRERASREQRLRTPTGVGLIGSTGIQATGEAAPYSLSAYESGSATTLATPPSVPVATGPETSGSMTPGPTTTEPPAEESPDSTETVSGSRARYALAGIALVALVAGGALIFRPGNPPRPTPPAVVP